MPLYEYYCQPCHGIFQHIRQMRDASTPAPCPECTKEAQRIMSTFNGFTMRDGYPRRIPDKGTYWHMGKEVKKRATKMVGNTHPELATPKAKARPTRGDIGTKTDQMLTARADALYKDKWGRKPDGMRSIKDKKVKPVRKTL